MRFMHPSLLAWGALLAVPVILYLFRRKPRKVVVSTLLFFKTLAREHQESAWLSWLKRLLSFLLSAAVIAFATFALARLVSAPPTDGIRSVVVLVDRSASMAAQDEKGETRLEEAKALIKERLAGHPSGIAVSVMAYDKRAEILLPRSLDRREVSRALASVRTRPIEGDAESAIALARLLAALDTPASIWHATDNISHRQDAKDAKEAGHGKEDRGPGVSVGHAADDTAPASAVVGSLGDLGVLAVKGVAVEALNVALASPVNAGITAFQLRRLPLEHGRFEAFVEVRGVSPGPLEATFEIRAGEALVAIRKLTLEPGGRERLLVPVAGDAGESLSLVLSAEGDCLAADDAVHARVPEVRPVRALWITSEPEPFTQLALASHGDESEIEVLHGGPDAWPPAGPAEPDEEIDVAIFDGWLPEKWPEDVSIIVIDPPGAAGPVRAVVLDSGGLPVEALRPTDERHPVLYGVATSRVEVTQTAVLESDGPLEPLWVGPSGPVLAAGEVRGQRIVVMAFAPGRSARLPLMASFPLLVGNAIYWSAAGGDGGSPEPRNAGTNLRTGELVSLEVVDAESEEVESDEAGASGTLTWSVPGPTGSAPETVAARGRWVELDRVGLWRADTGEEGSAALLSSRETCLATRIRPTEALEGVETKGTVPFMRGDLTPLLLCGIVAVLLAESYLFHRRAVY